MASVDGKRSSPLLCCLTLSAFCCAVVSFLLPFFLLSSTGAVGQITELLEMLAQMSEVDLELAASDPASSKNSLLQAQRAIHASVIPIVVASCLLALLGFTFLLTWMGPENFVIRHCPVLERARKTLATDFESILMDTTPEHVASWRKVSDMSEESSQPTGRGSALADDGDRL